MLAAAAVAGVTGLASGRLSELVLVIRRSLATHFLRPAVTSSAVLAPRDLDALGPRASLEDVPEVVRLMGERAADPPLGATASSASAEVDATRWGWAGASRLPEPCPEGVRLCCGIRFLPDILCCF